MGRGIQARKILDEAFQQDETLRQNANDATAAEMADYVQSMLAGLIEMNVGPSGETLRNILWLAKVEAQRLRDEAQGATHGRNRHLAHREAAPRAARR